LLSALAKLLLGSAATLLGSVAVDAWLDRDGARVRQLTNVVTVDGVRMYVAVPSPSAANDKGGDGGDNPKP
jgi:hypothetical protein